MNVKFNDSDFVLLMKFAHQRNISYSKLVKNLVADILHEMKEEQEVLDAMNKNS